MVARFGDLPPAERRRATEKLAAAMAADLERWSQSQELKVNWADRAEVAARLVPSGLERMTNDGGYVERKLGSLGSAEIVITNRYHSAYRATCSAVGAWRCRTCPRCTACGTRR